MKVIIHCSDSPNNRKVTAKDVHEWHLQKGWDGIGYHYFIERFGKLCAGRPEYWTGSHARGHNSSIGICLAGRDSFTLQQDETLRWLLKDIESRYVNVEVIGHYEVDSGKTCPNFDVKHWLATGEFK